MPKIQLTKDLETALNIGLQLEGPFMIGESPSTRAGIIGQLTGVNLVDHALKNINKDVLGNNRDIKLKGETIDKIDDKLKDFGDLTKLGNKIELANKMIQKLELLENTLYDYQNLKVDIDTNENGIAYANQSISNLKSTADLLPEIEKLETLYRERKSYVSMQLDLENNTKSLNTTRSEYDRIKPIADKQNVIQNLSDQNDILKELLSIEKDFDSINNEGIKITNELENLSHVTTEEVDTLARQVELLNSLSSIRADLKVNRLSINNTRKAIRQAGLNEQEANIEFQKILSEVGTCPTCGQSTEEEKHETHT